MSRIQALSSLVKLTEKLTAIDRNGHNQDLNTIGDAAKFMEENIDARAVSPVSWGLAGSSLEAAAANDTPELRKTATEALKFLLKCERLLWADDDQRRSDSETLSWSMDDSARRAEAYAREGQHLKDWTTDDLEGRWLRIVKDTIKKNGNVSASATHELNSVQCEMFLRKAALPIKELETDEVIAYAKLFTRVVNELPLEDRAQIEADIQAHSRKERAKPQ